MAHLLEERPYLLIWSIFYAIVMIAILAVFDLHMLFTGLITAFASYFLTALTKRIFGRRISGWIEDR